MVSLVVRIPEDTVRAEFWMPVIRL